MPTRWEYGSLITIALAPTEQQPPEHTVGILVTAMKARVVSVVELGDLVPGERYAAMNAVGEEGWIITGPGVRSDFSRGTPVRIGGPRGSPRGWRIRWPTSPWACGPAAISSTRCASRWTDPGRVHTGQAGAPGLYGWLMRVHVVSDVHGRAEALAGAGGADGFICLGDLLLFIDYADHRQGIFPELFGAEATRTFVALRMAKRFDEAREFSRRLWGQLDGDPSGYVQQAASSQYAELFAAMPAPAYMTYGNVDIPPLWQQHLKPGHEVLDGQQATLGGWTFGFVGGGLPSAYRTPYEIDEDAYAAKVTATGEVDVLCTHIPPAVPQLLYDTVARRLERGSVAVLEHIRRTQPRYALFGHVHQPLARRVRIGRTECINVGHFRATGVPYVLEW